MHVLIVAPDSPTLKALERSCAWAPQVRVTARVVNSQSDAYTLRGLEFHFIVGLDLLELDYRLSLAILLRGV